MAETTDLPDFDAARRLLGSLYPLVHDEPLALEIRAPGGDDVARAELAVGEGASWLLLAVPVCREDEVNAVAALRYNASLAAGSLALDGGRCVLRQTLRFGAATAGEVIATLEYLWREARRLRGGRGAGARVADLFTNLAE